MPSNRVIFLPLVHVELVSSSQTFTTIALLDSGATSSFIPYELADILGIIPTNLRSVPVETAGGTADFFGVRLNRLSLLSSGRVFSDFQRMLMLVPSNPAKDLPYVILGRDVVFRRFHITFKERVEKLVLHHHKWADP